MNEPTSYEELLTQDVLDAVRPYATKLAKRTRGGLDADELIQTAIESLLRRKRIPVTDMVKFLSRRIRFVYLEWVNGTNQKSGEYTQPSPQDRYMATGSLPVYDGVKQLTVENPSESWELTLDIERALHTLNAKDRRLVMLKFWAGLYNREAGVAMDVTDATIERWWAAIIPKLRACLAAYESLGPSGKRLNGSSCP